MCTSCKNENGLLSPSEELLSTPTWNIQEATGKGAGYDYLYRLGQGPDPFQFSKVRIKLNSNGTVTGTDNNGNPIKDASWKYYGSEKRMEISGTGVFGIDGSQEVLVLEVSIVKIKNLLKVPQLNAIVELNATLVPTK